MDDEKLINEVGKYPELYATNHRFFKDNIRKCGGRLPMSSVFQYVFVNESKTWAEAQRYCRDKFTDLATIENEQQTIQLMDTVNDDSIDLAWIGLYDDLNSWKWTLEDSDFFNAGEEDFRNWNNPGPDNSGERLCVYMFRGIWYTTSCTGSYYPLVCYDGRENASATYIFIPQAQTWTEAQRYCREHHTDLVSIRNEIENQKVQSITTYNDYAWIGLYRTRSWSDQSNSSFTYWSTWQPDTAGSCTVVSFSDSGKWADENCNYAFPFICYSELTSPRQYHFVHESKTWTEAQRYCRQNYTDLATIDNTDEMNRLINTVNGSYSSLAWIGLYDDVNSWRWSLEDDDFYQEGGRDFKNWYHEPNNVGGKELCVYMDYYGKWFDASCSLPLSFICYDGRVNATQNYIRIIDGKNWTEAHRYCKQHYTDLVNVRNQTENQIILGRTGGQVWIGLYRNRTWSDHRITSYENWRPQIQNSGMQPDNGTCTQSSCTRQYHFVSESKTWIEAQRYCREKYTDLATIDNMEEMNKLIKINKSWTEAQTYCRETYTDLATIDNTEEMNRLINTVNGSYNGSAWIGLYDDVNSWRWSLEDNDFYQEGERDFRNWYHEPNNEGGKELCVFMQHSGNWFDWSCDSYYAFVCYNGILGETLITYVTLIIQYNAKKDLDECVRLWNSHRIRRSRTAACPGGVPNELYYLPHRFGSRDCGFQIEQAELDALLEASLSMTPCGDPNMQEYLDFAMEHNQLQMPENWESASELYMKLKEMAQI
ncbi:macrophage mannose receptor 1-like isoform X2 [Labeo rohita]|uniref:Macrophage mannose receptor 1-like isoform X2 n=1 Tax=Labeo rohita TaxID=84645 RepID=A0A498NBR0_LABRO|nr:macrophage mannose receptor 1-like isoform X2 [Labeo rohita]